MLGGSPLRVYQLSRRVISDTEPREPGLGIVSDDAEEHHKSHIEL